ncbi:MAG: HAD family hydrolase [Planctomycetes bacterium]|nr:HAD family hydrolase [Planctomycetota bacterium]
MRDQLSCLKCKTAILRSFTLEPLVPMVRAGAAAAGIDLDVQLGDFNAYAQEIIDPGSRLYRFDANLVILAVQTRDIAPRLWQDFTDLTPADVDDAVQRVTNSFATWIETLRSHSQAHLVIHSLDLPPRFNQGVLDTQVESSQAWAIQQINQQLATLARQHTGVYVLDYDALIARHGRLNWYDPQKWLTVRLPIAADKLIHLAEEWLRFVCPLTGKAAKCLVCDLDNTLWGGIIGEDGIDGIQLGAEYPGAAYLELQRAILDLYQRGIILAICSKNNNDDAMEVLENHPHMLLRPHHFAAKRIDWNDKVRNLRAIAAQLNVGIDALAFIDDNPVECRLVRSQLPEITVIQLPEDPMLSADLLRRSPVFERLSRSDEDRTRGQMYAEQRRRGELKQTVASLEDFYESLGMQAHIALVTPATLPRVAQLTQKTNQFNLTTRRYSEQQIAALAADPDWRVYSVQVVDRFGDNGIVGVAITHRRDDIVELDTFLLSCRVIGRTVETAMLATIAEHAKEAGAARLVGSFIPTRKNAPAADFFKMHGFDCTSEDVHESTWGLDLTRSAVEPPPWIDRKVSVEGMPHDRVRA